MYHTIEFQSDLLLDVEISPQHHLEQVCVRKGSRTLAQLRPYVVETGDGPTEVADLYFSDGTASRTIPFSFFSFVD